jgi:exodeoxyribonuclease V alpha subunit
LVLLRANVPIGLLRRILRTYGTPQRVLGVLRPDPYALARDVSGIGFLTADRIARALGIAGDDVRRVAAGIVHLLAQDLDSGHCFIPRVDLPQRLSKELGITVSDARVQQAVDDLIQTHQIVLDESGGIYTRAAWDAEGRMGLF